MSRTPSDRSLWSSPSATHLPLRSGFGTHGLSALEFAALLSPVAVTVLERGSTWLWTLFVATFTVLIWQRVFAEFRHRPFKPDGIVVALAAAIVLPSAMPLWQVAIVLSFGILIGQEIFGGRGRNFLNPATVALAFSMFAFPGQPLTEPSLAVGIAIVPGALVLLGVGVISWRVLVAAAGSMLLVAAIATAGIPSLATISAGFFFGLVYFAADPVAAASTNPGRWIYGAGFGLATALLAGGDVAIMEAVVSAALLAGIFAPSIDSGLIALNVYARGRRDG